MSAAVLPACLVELVLAPLSFADRGQASAVCRSWRQAALEGRGWLMVTCAASEPASGFVGKRRGSHHHHSPASKRTGLPPTAAADLLRAAEQPRSVRLCFLSDDSAAVREVLDSVPASVVCLEIVGCSPVPAALVARLAARLPALRELHLRHHDGSLMPFVPRREDGVPRRPLERLAASVRLSGDAEAAPDLRRYFGPGPVAADELRYDARGAYAAARAAAGHRSLLEAHAAAGVRCRRLALAHCDLSDAGLLAAAAALLEGPAPALELEACRLQLPAAWPEGTLPGLRSLAVRGCGALDARALAWIAGLSASGSLAELHVDLGSLGGAEHKALRVLHRARCASPPGLGPSLPPKLLRT